MDYSFVTDLEYYLRSIEKTSANTTMKYIRMLKKVLNDLVRKNLLDKNPFQQFKCTFKWPEKEVVTSEELGIINLEPSDISVGIDGNKWLVFNRQKTDTLVRVPILEQALVILDKYKDHPASIHRGRVFPLISNQKLNSYLKEIGDVCGITKNLTFHLARHTFATTITLANGVPIESVSKMLGHTRIATTQHYAKVIEKKLGEDMGVLQKKLLSR